MKSARRWNRQPGIIYLFHAYTKGDATDLNAKQKKRLRAAVEEIKRIPAMKKNAIPFNADDLIRSVEEVRDAVTGRRKLTLRTTKLPKPAPAFTPRDVQRIRARLKVSQSVFAAMLNVPIVTAISWEKGRRQPSGAALRLLQIAREHPEMLAVA